MDRNATWNEHLKLIYENCVSNVSKYMDSERKYTVFNGSTALAIVFGLDKEETLKDIVKFREQGNVFGE